MTESRSWTGHWHRGQESDQGGGAAKYTDTVSPVACGRKLNTGYQYQWEGVITTKEQDEADTKGLFTEIRSTVRLVNSKEDCVYFINFICS